MKKVLSLFLAILLVMSLAILPVSAADDSCPFVKLDAQYGNNTFMALNADGNLYELFPQGSYYTYGDVEDYLFVLKGTDVSDVLCNSSWYSFFSADVDYPVASNNVEEYGETIRFERMVGNNLCQTTAGDVFKLYDTGVEYMFTTETVADATNNSFLTISGKLYTNSRYTPELVAENVLDFCDTGEVIYYRKSNGDLYRHNYNAEATLVMKNCSSLYNNQFAKDNNGNWYHIGYNYSNCLEPEKFVDGNNITPERFDEFVKASTYIFKTRNLEWKLNGDVYLNGEFLIGNAIYVGRYEEVRIVTESGEVYMLFETDESYSDYESCLGDFTNTGLVMKDPVETMRRNGPEVGAFVTTSGGLGLINDSFDRSKEFYSAYEIKGSKYITRSDWAVAELTAADEAGFIDSVKNLEMRQNITRLEFCNMIVDFAETVKGAELSTVSKNPFEDVEEEDQEAVLKAYANGIIAGISATAFNPDGNITREQMCAIMTRTIKYLNPAVSFGTPIQFTDMTSVSDWAVEGVNAMSGLGIVKGDGVSINPQSQTTIEQAIAMTYRLYGKMK